MDAEQLEFLYGFGENFSEKAANNLLDPCIGREEELAQVIETLSRRRKNNPMLVNQAWVKRLSWKVWHSASMKEMSLSICERKRCS